MIKTYECNQCTFFEVTLTCDQYKKLNWFARKYFDFLVAFCVFYSRRQIKRLNKKIEKLERLRKYS